MYLVIRMVHANTIHIGRDLTDLSSTENCYVLMGFWWDPCLWFLFLPFCILVHEICCSVAAVSLGIERQNQNTSSVSNQWRSLDMICCVLIALVTLFCNICWLTRRVYKVRSDCVNCINVLYASVIAVVFIKFVFVGYGVLAWRMFAIATAAAIWRE